MREEYTKIVSKGIPPTGLYITDFERDAILVGEAAGKKWQKKILGTVEADPAKTVANQLAQLGGLSGPVWIRDDGAVAHLNGIMPMNLILETPAGGKTRG